MTDSHEYTSPAPADKVVFPVDPEHAALRLTVIASFFVVSILTYLIISVILPQDGFNLVGLVVGLGVATVTIQVIDAAFKRRWPSGRTLEIDEQGVRLALHGDVQSEIANTEAAQALMWRFEIQRRARAPKGWYVVALALNQDDVYLPVYTFMSPQDFQAMPFNQFYTPLSKDKPLAEAANDFRAAGHERRLRTAEHARWNAGAEIDKANFHAYVEVLRRRYPQWLTRD